MKTLHTIYSTFAKYNMAKFLTVLTILFTVGVESILGAEVTVSLSDGEHDGTNITWTAADGNITITQSKGTSTTAVNSSYISAPRVYKGHILSFEAKEGYKIKQIDLKYSGNYYGNSMTAGTVIANNKVTDNTSEVNRTWYTTNNGTHVVSSVSSDGLSAIYIQNVASASNVQLRLTSIVITYVEESSIPANPYTVTLSAGPGSCAESVTETSAGEGVTLPKPTLSSACQSEGWSFAGWKTTSAVATETTTEPTLIAAGAYSPTSDITLYAVYKRTDGGGGGGNTSVTFTDEDSGGWTTTAGKQNGTKDGVSISTTNGIYSQNNNQLRVYKDATFTVSSENIITSIVFSSSNYDWSDTSDGDYLNKTWTGNTNSVTFTAGNGQVRITQLVVTVSAGGTTSTTYYHSTPDCGTPTPTPTLNVDPATLTFENTTTNTSTEKTFTLTGSNLTANASLQLSGINPGMFSLSSNSVTQSAGSINQTITVTYTPAAAGEHTATLTISSTGAESKTVTLSGTGVAPAAKYTVTWMVGSNSVLTEEVANATGVTQTPDNPANDAIGNCADAFVGWTETPLGSAEGQSAPADLCTAAQMKSKYTSVTDDKIFYAVFATAEGDGSAEGWTLTSNGLSDLTTNDVFVFAVSADGTYYAMPNDEGTSSSPNLTAITVEDSKITSEVQDKLKWNISGNATNGYIFYPNGSTTTWLYCNTTASSSNNDNIRVGTGSRKAWKQNSSTKYLYNDDNTTRYLSRNSTTDFRSYVNTNNSPIVPKVFRYNAGTTYSNYVTNCCALATATNLAVSGTTANSATLTWTAPSPITGITELQVQVRDENGIVKVENLAANATTATITELSECTEYTFCIASVGDCEVVSNTITAQPYSGAKTVTFVYGNEQPNTTFTTDCDNQSTALPIPTWSGYRFMGWFTAESDGTEIDDNPYTPTEDITLFAHWAKEYSVTYDANGGSTTCANGNYIEGETVTLCTSTPSKTGYTFADWTYSPEVTITDGKFTMPANNVIITAQWTINQYTVTWNPNGGKWGESTADIVHTYDYGAKINRPADPTRDGYRFTGWNATIASTMPATNITYTAQWKQNYTITFHDGDDTTPWTQTIDAESIDLNTHVGTHACGEYNFAGWSTDATLYNDQTANITTWVTGTYTPTANINLYAVYVKGDLATDFTLNCAGGVYEIWEKGHNQHMAGRQNGGGDKFYTTEYWDANNSESNGAPFTITKVADNTYTLQNADGQYITRDSYYEDKLEIEETSENADRYKWTISNGTNGTWRFTNKAATSYALVYYDNRYFELRSASSVTAGNTTTYDLELTPAQTNVYQSNPNCGPYYIRFETHGGEFIQGEEYPYGEEQTGLTETTYAKFPAAELEGYTFAGWKDGSPIDDEITADNAVDGPYLKQAGEDLIVSSNKTYHAVYYYYDEEEDIDFSKEFTTSIYAEVNGMKYFLAGTPSSGTMSSTTDCGYVSEVTITPGTGANAGKYKITVNGVAMAPKENDTDLLNGTYWWTITERSVGSGEYKISGQDKKNIVLRYSSWGHYTYNQGSEYGDNYYYPRFGKCLQHHWTSNPPIKLTVTYNPNGATSGTAPVDNNYYQIGGKVYVLGSNDLQKENYAFGGWNTQADGLGDNYEEGEDFNITKNTTLYAKWDCATYVNITKGTPVNGTFNLSVTGTQYTCEDGFVVSVTDIVPATGYRFDLITQEGVDAANVEINNNDKTVTYKQLSNGSSTINVVFAAILYTVTWDPNGGNWGGSTNNKVETYNYGVSITKPADPTRTGYTFAGWSPTPASNMPAENVIYTAQWTANTNTPYVVEHYQQNLDLSYPITPTEKESFTGTTDTKVTPTVKTYEGFTSPATQEVTIAADGSLVVRYEYKRDSYKLTWDLAGGDITTAGTDEGNVLYGTELKAPRVAKVDNVFMGWEPEVPATMPDHDATYVAQWIELTNFRTFCKNSVTWVVNGGKWADGTTADIVDIYTRGQEIIPPTDPTLDGWKFMGWDPEFVEGTTMQGNDHIYTAQWKELIPTSLQWSEEAYTATMEADNDFPDLTILPNDFAGELTYQSFDPAVATIAADGTITLIGTGTTIITASIVADDTYLAASDSYELTVAASNCKWVEVTDNTTLEDGDEVVITMTKGNYVWTISNEKNTSTAPTANDITANIQGNYLTTVSDEYKWVIEKNNANLTFYSYSDNANYLYCTNAENGNGVRVGTGDAKVFVVDGNYLKNTQTTDPRYVGISYNTTPYSWRCYTVTTGVIADETLKFYKRECLDSEHYWLTWDATDGQFADGSKQIVKDYAVGTTINKPFDPTRTGYEFAGWSIDGVNVVTPAEKMPEENLSYSAVWQIKSYTVTWDADGGQFADGKTVIEQTYEYGAIITKPADPTRTGYTFKGWSPNVPDKMSTDNLKFVAQWQVNQYTITWDPGEGGHWGDSFVPIVENYNYGDPINKPTNPEKAGYVFDKWEPDVVATMPNNNLTYTAKWNEAFCDAYTFHTGNANVWNDPQEQICFEFKANHEWQIINYVIPMSDAQSHFLVAYKGWPQIDQGSLGGHSKSATSTWSATMYLAPSMDSNDGNGSPKVGHAKGAVGTLRIFDDSNWDNLYVGFIPNGYKLKFGANEYDFEHYEDAEYRSEIVEYNSTTANNNVSVGVINTNNAYVKTDHTQEGMRHIFVRDKIGWMNDGAKVAIYYWKGDKNGWSGFLTKVPGETNLYVGLIPVDYTSVKLIRYKNTYAGAPGSWSSEDRWNETGDLTISTTQQLLTFSDWNNNPTASTYKHKGKFRIYNNSWDKNWYVHFYPHYVITFDKNAEDATGTMQPQALPLDANPMTIVLNECTFERRGYDFTGWETDVAITADGNSVAANGNVKDKATISNINKDITLKAQWKAQSYTIYYKDQGDVAYSGENLASLPQTHTYDQTTTLVAGVKTGYTFGGWYLTPECDGTAVTELGAQDYTADITLYAKWTFAMEYNITNTETIFITSAKGQTIKATTPLQLAVSNMPVGTKVAISAPNITFYDEAGNAITEVATKSNTEQFNLTIAYTPTVENTTEQPTITLSVLGNEKTFDGHISARSLPNTFAIVAKVGNLWYALPSQGLNSTDDLMGYAIEVDNQDDPTFVTSVPANADWSLRQVYAGQNVNATKDRFKQYGNNLVFVNSDVKALNASKSDNHVLTDATYEAYKQSDNQGLYEWTPTTNDLETYQLTNANPETGRNIKLSMNITNIFGVHKQNVATSDLRFLPIQEPRYTQAALQVVEWKENSVVIMYNGDPAQMATLAIDGTTAIGSATLNKVNKDVAIYELPASGLMNYATKRLLITIGSSKKWLTIPYIINNSTTDVNVLNSTNTTKAVAAVTDVVVLNDATFTAAGTKKDKYTFRTIHVYGGGKLVVPSEATEGLGIYSLVMRSGTIENGTYTNSYPQLVMNGKYSNTSGIYLDYITTYERYYALSVPYSVKTKNIKYPADIYGDNLKDGGNRASFALQYYDGAARATGASGWKDFDESGDDPTLIPYQGYTFWGAPRKVSVNGGAMERQKYGIHRIQLGVGADPLLTAENSDKTIDIIAYPAERPNDMGWNFLGNPYLAQYGGLSASDEDVQVGLLEQEMIDGKWTGGWKHTGNLRYITTTTDGQTYTPVEVDKATFSPFNTFFIQAFKDGALQFASASRAQNAPARHYAAQQEAAKEITTGIILTGNDQTDRTGLLIADNFTEEYDFNADLSKFENSGINLYTIGKDGKLAFMAINQVLAEQPIPLGYGAPADGEYTIAFDEDRYNATDISALYLIDYDRNETTNLLHTDYSFVTAAGTNNERFALQVAFIPQNATSVEWVDDATIQVAVDGNNLLLNNLPTDAGVQVFDALGRVIYATPNAPTEMQITLPTGYYLVRIADKQHAVVINTIIP